MKPKLMECNEHKLVVEFDPHTNWHFSKGYTPIGVGVHSRIDLRRSERKRALHKSSAHEEVRRMKNNCCDIKVKETENGYRIDITGEGVKEKCKTAFDNCCSDENIKKCFQGCCGSGE